MNNITDQARSQHAVSAFLAKDHGLLIDGKWVAAQSGENRPVYNPAEGSTIAHVAEGGAADVDLAVAAARRAFEGSWSHVLPQDRAKMLWRLGDLIDAHADELALLDTLNNGKTLASAKRVDVPNSSDCFRYNAGWATKITGDTLSSSGPEDWHGYTMREPVGVAGLIVAWNFPLFQATMKLAPALAAGCTVVLKPAEQTPLSALRLGELILEAGFPPGVVNIVTGAGHSAGAAITAHPGVDKVSFTGSTVTGKRVLEAARGNLKRVTLELGGKSPTIIFADADLGKAIPAAAMSIFFNSGQVCTAGSRLFVHHDVFDRVVDGIARRAESLKVGAGIEPDTELGPVVSQVQLDRVLAYLERGTRAGAHVVTGGKRIGRPGYFVEPTILTQTTQDMDVRQQEIFGPVVCAMPFDSDDLDSIAAQANETVYGLAAYVWTRDLGTAHKMARKIRAGLVNVNGGRRDATVPSGGFKQSGWGREHGRAGWEAYTEIKSVIMGL